MGQAEHAETDAAVEAFAARSAARWDAAHDAAVKHLADLFPGEGPLNPANSAFILRYICHETGAAISAFRPRRMTAENAEGMAATVAMHAATACGYTVAMHNRWNLTEEDAATVNDMYGTAAEIWMDTELQAYRKLRTN